MQVMYHKDGNFPVLREQERSISNLTLHTVLSVKPKDAFIRLHFLI
jgi:hypothetical protein